MRTMYDSVTVSDIPADATMVAGYVNGHYANVAAIRDRFPDAVVVGLSVDPNDHVGDVYDCEAGNGHVSDVPGWVAARRAAGLARPTVYLSRSLLVAAQGACIQLGVPQPDWWVADWTGTAHEIPGAVAVQYASPENGSPGHYDITAVYDDTWHPSGLGDGHGSTPPGDSTTTPAPEGHASPLEAAVLGFPNVGPSGTRSLAANKVQGLLRAFYPKLDQDGFYGLQTTAAARDFQGRHGLKVDGIVGPITVAKLLTA